MSALRAVTLLVGMLAVPVTSAGQAAGDQAGGRRLALLVGCTRYGRLPQRMHLDGPANDVVLMYRLLQNRFGFLPENIRVLAEPDHLSEALAEYEMEEVIGCEQPTADHIQREFEHLIETAEEGDQIFILLAGHGSQQPDLDADARVDPEPDGYDEVFLPRDIGRWHSATQAVEKAITDDQLGRWVAGLMGKGAFVFFVADSCHSGTVTRGSDDVTSRDVSRDLLGVPDDFVPTPGSPGEVAPTTGWLDAAEQASGPAGLVALYAAQSNEEAIEFRPHSGGPKHGRLSYAVHEIFEQCDRAITYSELKQRLLWTYSQRRWTNRSTPDMEGTDLDREVLGVESWRGRSDLTLLTVEGRLSVSGGVMQGLTPDSILAVYPPAGAANADEVLGYVVVTESRPFSALAEAIAFADLETAESFPDHARCELHHRAPGPLQIAVSVEAEGFDDPDAAESARVELEQELAGLQGEETLFRVAGEDDPADWYVVLTPGQTYLQKSGSDFALEDADGLRSGEVLALAPTRSVEEEIQHHLERIAWASNLIALSEQAAAVRDPLIDIQISVSRGGEEFHPGEESESRVRDGDVLSLEVTNCGVQPVSLVVFYVDATYGVDLFFPYDRREISNNRIGIGESLYKSIDFQINDSTVGWEHVLVFAIPAEDQDTIQSLRNVQQSGLGVKARGASGANATPLARLVERAAGGTRGASRSDASPPADSYAIRRIVWEVVSEGS